MGGGGGGGGGGSHVTITGALLTKQASSVIRSKPLQLERQEAKELK